MANEYYFVHTRKAGTNIPEQECLGILSRKQFYKFLVENVSNAREKLMIANTPTTVEDALIAMETLMLSYSNDPYIEESVAGRIQETLIVIRKVRMHDLKRGSLSNNLALLLKDSKKIIKEEEKKEQQHREALQSLLLEMSEHIPEIVALVDLDKIFKNLD